MENYELFYGITKDFFEKNYCKVAATEIAQQPAIWNEVIEILIKQEKEITKFIEKCATFAERINNLRIILTGAGSSAFVGEAIALAIGKKNNIHCEAIHTTDIVTEPECFLFPNKPTLLISIARSGNSPESVGAVNYARKIIKNLFEVTIVCDDTSALYKLAKTSENCLTIVMPKRANDQGFAMTSSVTAMMIAVFALFNSKNLKELQSDIVLLSQNIESCSKYFTKCAKKLSLIDFDRMILLGSGTLKGIGHEAGLKIIEYTNGVINYNLDTAPGFRHGPKAVVKAKTLSMHLISSDPFTAQYDVDLFIEMLEEKKENFLVAISDGTIKLPKESENVLINSQNFNFAKDLCHSISVLVFMQMFAMFKALAIGKNPDNPAPGEVNRVVKGVTVYSK